MTGFRFALVLASGEPADPAVFATIVPSWGVGDEFLAGAELQKFRIVAIEPDMGDDGLSHGVWIVEPVG